MTQNRGCLYHVHAPKGCALLPNPVDNFDYVVHVALGVGTARNRQTNQLVGRRRGFAAFRILAPEHDRPNFARPDTACEVQLHGQGLTWKIIPPDVGQKQRGVQENSMTTRGSQHGNRSLVQAVHHVCDAGCAIVQVVLAHGFVQSLSYRFQVPSGKTSVGGEAFGDH